ncbi:chemotaxis protein ched [Heliomicrobium modesticaldum Ice1]|uniref:Probable chemoreceptor glutamine deamidase CheD n=1 Tax=Heliobacterium modesticaldum (strain ATCC 51547 / Ice1) TaxID=498761 RepID=B0THD0_HELMI|nr:chemotaxis protein CheD [Heliomicrobium modesticaldum]ABZ84805.1 chemotaxis protein ched [Heliomicrobium modesticaldum Ice1]
MLIKVGMADLKAAKAPDNLMTSGLGSCIGICLYDAVAKVGGLAHIMLPASTQARSSENKAKFADTAIPVLLEEMIKLGAIKSRLVAKIAGGAQMFSFPGASDVMRIGERNAEAVVLRLKQENIPLLARETGGNFGRTIELDTMTGKLHIRTIDRGEKAV